MAIVDAIPGSPTANAYCTVAAATLYLDERLHTEPWDTATPEDQATAVIWATSLLDEQVRWHGTPTTTTQALAWPQMGQVDRYRRPIPSDVVPDDVQKATAYYALALLKDQTDVPGSSTQAVKRKTIGGLTVEYQSTQTTQATRAAYHGIPSEVRAILAPYGRMMGGVVIPLLKG